ncbi:MAG: SprT-like domain-containing protein [Flavobacteriaceae bacterium]
MKPSTVLTLVPDAAVEYVSGLLSSLPVAVKITKKRLTKHGDYRRLADGNHQITLNTTANPYRFLITLIHELSHFVAFETYGFNIKPHGKEWKKVYQEMMSPLIQPPIFPSSLLPLLVDHFKNPKASTDTDFNLVRGLHQYDTNPDKTYVFQLHLGDVFALPNGRKFVRGIQRRKRFECVEMGSQKRYLINPQAVVEKLE